MRLACAFYLQCERARGRLYIRIMVFDLTQGAEIPGKRKAGECQMLARSAYRRAGLLILDAHLAKLTRSTAKCGFCASG